MSPIFTSPVRNPWGGDAGAFNFLVSPEVTTINPGSMFAHWVQEKAGGYGSDSLLAQGVVS